MGPKKNVGWYDCTCQANHHTTANAKRNCQRKLSEKKQSTPARCEVLNLNIVQINQNGQNRPQRRINTSQKESFMQQIMVQTPKFSYQDQNDIEFKCEAKEHQSQEELIVFDSKTSKAQKISTKKPQRLRQVICDIVLLQENVDVIQLRNNIAIKRIQIEDSLLKNRHFNRLSDHQLDYLTILQEIDKAYRKTVRMYDRHYSMTRKQNTRGAYCRSKVMKLFYQRQNALSSFLDQFLSFLRHPLMSKDIQVQDLAQKLKKITHQGRQQFQKYCFQFNDEQNFGQWNTFRRYKLLKQFLRTVHKPKFYQSVNRYNKMVQWMSSDLLQRFNIWKTSQKKFFIRKFQKHKQFADIGKIFQTLYILHVANLNDPSKVEVYWDFHPQLRIFQPYFENRFIPSIEELAIPFHIQAIDFSKKPQYRPQKRYFASYVRLKQQITRIQRPKVLSYIDLEKIKRDEEEQDKIRANTQNQMQKERIRLANCGLIPKKSPQYVQWRPSFPKVETRKQKIQKAIKLAVYKTKIFIERKIFKIILSRIFCLKR